MKFQDRIDYLESREYCLHLIGEPSRINNDNEPDGRKEYAQSYLEINGESVLDKKVHIVVLHEGTDIEVAYWKAGMEPKNPNA
jgi:hypothetical protein